MGDGERRARSVPGRLRRRGRLEPRGPARRQAGRLGLGPRRRALQPARALRRPAARARAGLLLARAGRGRGGAAHRLERAGALRHRPRRCRRLGRGPLDRLRGHAGAGEARPGNPRSPRPEAPAEAEAAGRAAPAPRVHGAPARRAGPALRERPRPLRGVPQRREGGRPVPRAGLDGLRPHRALRRVRRDRAAARRPERDRGHRRERLPPHRARALPQARDRLRLAEAPRGAAHRVRGRPPRDPLDRPRLEGGAVAGHLHQHLRGRGLRRAARARGLDRHRFRRHGLGPRGGGHSPVRPNAGRDGPPAARDGDAAAGEREGDGAGRLSLRLRPERLGHRAARACGARAGAR